MQGINSWPYGVRRLAAAGKLVGLVMLVLHLSAAACPGAERSNSKVKVSATATRPDADGKQDVTLQLVIQDGWHIYANPGPPDFSDNATVVTIDAKSKPQEVKVDYPPGKLAKDSVLGEYRRYEDTVTIKATVRRAKGDSGPLQVSIKVNACSHPPDDKDGECLLPGTVELTVP